MRRGRSPPAARGSSSRTAPGSAFALPRASRAGARRRSCCFSRLSECAPGSLVRRWRSGGVRPSVDDAESRRDVSGAGHHSPLEPRLDVDGDRVLARIRSASQLRQRAAPRQSDGRGALLVSASPLARDPGCSGGQRRGSAGRRPGAALGARTGAHARALGNSLRSSGSGSVRRLRRCRCAAGGDAGHRRRPGCLSRRRSIRRAIAASIACGAPDRFAFKADATYLITGGLGALGLHVARWMVDRGARSLVLSGRKGTEGAAKPALDQLRAAGARVIVARADMARREDVQRLLSEIAASHPPLRGIVHAAGVLDDGVLLQQDWERFARVMAPKIAGSWNLHSLTLDLPLDFFVLFSSASSVLGSPGQTNYAAANAFMDALAHLRRSQGLPALSINWGAWSVSGMAATLDERDQRRWAERGLVAMSPADALASLGQLLDASLRTGGRPADGLAALLRAVPRRFGARVSVSGRSRPVVR